MPKVDWDDDGAPPMLAPGIYAVEVRVCIEERTRAGHGKFRTLLRAVDFDRDLCWVNIVLEGPGRWSGLNRLRALGFGEGCSIVEIEASDLFGRRAFAAVREETYNGRRTLTVPPSSSALAGFWKADDEPPGVIRPPAPKDGHGSDDAGRTPF